jgi:hypothetical protein
VVLNQFVVPVAPASAFTSKPPDAPVFTGTITVLERVINGEP